MTREEKLQKAHQMFDKRNLLIELKWQREYFKRGYVSNQEELFNLWIFDECIKALEQEQKIGHWIVTDDDLVYCSECENSYYSRPIDASWYYCPHCGARMDGEE